MGSIRNLKSSAHKSLKLEEEKRYLMSSEWWNGDEAREIALKACYQCCTPPELKSCGSGLDGYCEAQREILEEETERLLNGIDEKLA
jgi:hypothetical protein